MPRVLFSDTSLSQLSTTMAAPAKQKPENARMTIQPTSLIHKRFNRMVMPPITAITA